MGRIKSLINITADGFADSQYVIVDPEYYEFTHGLLSDTRTIAFGRKTFEQFQDRWPPMLEKKDATDWQLKMARVLDDKQKIVFSSTLKTTRWNNTSIVQNLNADCLSNYKKQGEGGLTTIGSFSLVAALAVMNLIDDYYFCIQPLIAGSGSIRLFEKIKLDTIRPLEYVDSQQLETGVHIIHYQSEN